MQIPSTCQIENGDIIRIYPDQSPKIIDKAPIGKMYLDGNIGVSAILSQLKKEKNISNNGYLEVTLIVTSNGKVKKPIISFKGIPQNDLEDNFVFEMEDEIFNICRTFSIDNKNQEKKFNRFT